MGVYTIKEGDCIESIAFENGLFWEKIWDHPENAELKKRRENPNVLMVGDKLFIPEVEVKQIAGQTEQKHSFRRKGVPCEFHIILKEGDEPIADTRYVLVIDSQSFTGSTESDGSIKVSISPNAKTCKLTIGDEPDKKKYSIQLGQLNPIETIAGVKQRLSNLGFFIDETSNEITPKTVDAIKAFQSYVGIPTTGQLDDTTRQALLDKHET